MPIFPLISALLGLLLVPVPDDLVPTTVEALLAQPDDLIFFGIPEPLPADLLLAGSAGLAVRCLTDLGDVTGDGRSDVALGLAPGAAAKTLQAIDGVSGALLWSHSPDGGGFRGTTNLDARDGLLVAGASSPRGRVTCVDAATGVLRWRRDLLGSAGPLPVNLFSTRWVDDVNGDGVADVIVAAGQGLDGALLLSGADGSTFWGHAFGDVVYDLMPVHDLDGDGRPDLLAVGGDQNPRAVLLSVATGAVLWSVPLDGPGTCVMPLLDGTGDLVPDLAVGQWNSPGPCLLALSGADGSRIWESAAIEFNVTSLAPAGDMMGSGLIDIAVGSFDNAISGVQALNGVREWRREGSTSNTGAMLSVVALGDLDQSGLPELGTVSQDHRFFVMGGTLGQFMAGFDTGARGAVVTSMSDQDGDGRPEILVGGNDGFFLLDGNAGLAGGPLVQIEAPATLGDEGALNTWAFPGTYHHLFAAPDTGFLWVPAWKVPFGLDLASTVLVFQGPVPGAGVVSLNIPLLPASLAGVTFYFQATQAFGPGNGWLSNVASLTVPTL